MQEANSLADSGSWDEAIRMLTEANHRQEDEDIETRLVKLRHLAFNAIDRSVPAPAWPKQVQDHFPDASSLPEIPASELSVELVASAIQHHGSIIVRGLFGPEACAAVRHSIDEAFAGAAAVAGEKQFDPTPWYAHFVPQRGQGYKLSGVDRLFVNEGFGVLAVDAPRALLRYLDCLVDAGIDKFLYEYFGERPAISAKKSTLRRTPHNAPAGWHQDGHFLGNDIRALNIWAAFSRCGVDAPSLDVFAKRFDYFVEAGGPGLPKDAISEESVAGCGLEHVVRPEFDAGDALLFDEKTLHRTGVDKAMTKTRYAVEMWFFAASKFPRDYVPLYL
jgi:hypothetical protein